MLLRYRKCWTALHPTDNRKKGPPVAEKEEQQEGYPYDKKVHEGGGLTDVIRSRKAAGETNRAIGKKYGLSKTQVKQLVNRQNRKERLLAAGYVAHPKGRPRRETASEEVRQHNELVKLRMQVELLRNFLSEAGRRKS